MKKFILILFVIPICTSCNYKTNELKDNNSATSTLAAKNNSGVFGSITFIEVNGKVSMTANVGGLDPGKHAIHIHAIGDCSAYDGSSAKGHWNPTKSQHGEWESEQFHIGDIGNLEVDEDGRGVFSRETDLWCIGCDDHTKNILGKSIIIHAGIDDFSTQPAGASGDRIACGVIVKN